MKQLWMRIPGVFYGVAILSGVSFYFCFPYPLLLGITGKNRISIFGFYLIAFLSYLNTNVSVDPELPGTYTKGTGYYSVNKIRRSIATRHGFFNYQGELSYYKSGEKEYFNLPCYITVPDNIHRPLGNCDYVINGKLKYIEHGLYRMVVDEWHPVKRTYSVAELRLCLKDRMRRYLKHHVKDRLTYSFFSSLGTGEIENQVLGILFSRAGLSHTLAISGFHYTWLLIALWGITSVFFPGRGTPIVLIILITAYFFFIGESPSLKRAWLASTIFCFSMLITNKANGLNSLGLATAISLGLDPNTLFSIGYQLSYLATFSILAIYPTIEMWARKILPQRNHFEMAELPFIDQIIARLAGIIRRILVLTLVINLSTFVMVLYYFDFFSLTGLLFNLFFPLAITLSLLGIFIGLLPIIGPFVLAVNAWYSRQLLEMIYWGISGQGEKLTWVIPSWSVAWFVMGIISIGLFLSQRRYELTRI